jgi:hypothetical protein
MKKTLLSLYLIGSPVCYSQIGVNTNNPSATFDIIGKATDSTVIDGLLAPRITGDQLKAKDQVYNSNQNGVIVYVTNPVGISSSKTVNVNTPGYYYYDAPNSVWSSFGNGNSSGSGTSIYASKKGDWSLVSLGVSGTNWSKISLTSSDTKTGVSSLLNNGVYTAPEAGIYKVEYEFQLQGGIDLTVLAGKKLGIFKNGTTLFEEKNFDAVRTSILGATLASIPVTSTALNTLIKLNKNETLTFAVETGGANLGLLTSNQVYILVHKISN